MEMSPSLFLADALQGESMENGVRGCSSMTLYPPGRSLLTAYAWTSGSIGGTLLWQKPPLEAASKKYSPHGQWNVAHGCSSQAPNAKVTVQCLVAHDTLRKEHSAFGATRYLPHSAHVLPTAKMGWSGCGESNTACCVGCRHHQVGRKEACDRNVHVSAGGVLLDGGLHVITFRTSCQSNCAVWATTRRFFLKTFIVNGGFLPTR